MSKLTADEKTTSIALRKAFARAEDAERAAARVRDVIDTYDTKRMLGYDTPYKARNAAITARTSAARMVMQASSLVRHAEYQAEKARHAAKTPLARKLAAEAQEAVTIASRHANEALRMSYAACTHLITHDAWAACRAYETASPLT
jgi:hypothetical protein